MTTHSSRRGISRVDSLVIVGVIVLLSCLFFPAVSAVTETARRASCIGTMKMISLGLHNYHSLNRCFPPSMVERPVGHLLSASSPVPGTDNSNGNGADYSWSVLLLPHIEGDTYLERLDAQNAVPFDGNADRKQVAAIPCVSRLEEREGPLQKCPSFQGSSWSGAPEYSPKSAAIGNYVALGATHLASLYRTETLPIGGPSHPNGTMYPGSKTTIDDLLAGDGTSNTFIICETREQNYAAWVDGTTAAVVGLAEQTHPTFELRDGQAYYSPTAGVRTSINWGNDRTSLARYYLPGADHSGSQPWVHGPSSFHPGVVNHGLCDGSVQCISENIDPTIYMHLITRHGGEPVDKFFN